MTPPPHLLHVFSTFVPAGPEVRTVRLINALGSEFRHSILAIDGRTDAAALLDPAVDARLLPSLPRAGTPATVRALRAVLRAERPDAVCSYNWGAFDSVLATRFTRLARRHLHHEDGFNIDEAERFKPRRVWTRRLLLQGVARVIVPSHTLATIARDEWRLLSNRVELVPNGIDLDAFSARDGNPALRAELGLAVDTPVIGFVGHLRPVKNPERLVRAFATVSAPTPPALVLLGEGDERGRILEVARELGVEERVHLVGHQADTAPWYRLMDAFALSSDSEQMPVALLEAMASGLPVASTDVGDVRHMLPQEQGELVVAGEADARGAGLARALERLVQDAALRARLGAANRARVEERYTFERMLTAYRRLYLDTLAS